MIKNFNSFKNFNENSENETIIKKYPDGYYWSLVADNVYNLKKDDKIYVVFEVVPIYGSNNQNYEITKIQDSNGNKPVVEGLFKAIYNHILDFLLTQKQFFQFSSRIDEDKNFTILDLNSNDLTKLFLRIPDFAIISDSFTLSNLAIAKKISSQDLLNILEKEQDEINPVLISKAIENKFLSIDEIKTLISKKENFLKNCSEYVIYQLYKNNIISVEEFADQFSDLDFFDDELCLTIDDYDDLSEFMEPDEKKNIIKFLGEDSYEVFDSYSPGDFGEDEFSECWKYLTQENKEYIIEKNKTTSFEEDGKTYTLNGYYFNKKDFYFDIDGEPTLVEDIFINHKEDEFEDVWDNMRDAYSDAYRWSVENQAHENIFKHINDLFGKSKSVKRGKYTGKDGKKYDKYIFIFKNINLSIFNNGAKTRYSEDDEEFYTEADYGSYLGFFKDEVFDEDSSFEKISFDEPQYGFYGDIKKHINDAVVDLF